MGLRSNRVSRCLDKSFSIAGFEIFDLLLIMLSLGVLQILFGQTEMKIVLVWVPPVFLAAAIRIGKRGKPERYFMHKLKFLAQPKRLSAFKYPEDFGPFCMRKKNEQK